MPSERVFGIKKLYFCFYAAIMDFARANKIKENKEKMVLNNSFADSAGGGTKNFLAKIPLTIGKSITRQFVEVPYVAGYIGRVFRHSFLFLKKDKAAAKILIMQLLFTFIEALPLICILSLAMGLGIYMLGFNFLLSFGQADLVYMLQVVIVSRELGPVLVAVVVTARSATAIATELASMVVTHQVESYVSIGIDPINHLAVPRFLGVTLSVMFLNLYFSLCGLFGPMLVSHIIGQVTAADFLDGLLKTLTLGVIGTSILKSILFGMVISLTATYYGFSVELASTEIPVATFFMLPTTALLMTTNRKASSSCLTPSAVMLSGTERNFGISPKPLR